MALLKQRVKAEQSYFRTCKVTLISYPFALPFKELLKNVFTQTGGLHKKVTIESGMRSSREAKNTKRMV